MVLKKQPLTPEERMPLTAWQGKYNMTSMPIQVYFEENLDLMKRLIFDTLNPTPVSSITPEVAAPLLAYTFRYGS